MANCVKCGRQLPPFSFKKICQWCVQHEAAQRGEIAEDTRQRVMPAPWVRRGESSITLTHVLFGANVAVFLAMAFASGSVVDFPGQTLARFGANYGPWTLSGQWWRLFTYMFLHGGLMHIAFNMWCLWDLGALCESLYGRWTYAAIYLITGIAAGIGSLAWNPVTLSVGASGAIFGLAGALIASFYLGEFSLPGIAIKGTLRSLLFFAGFNIFFGSVVSGIDNAAHFGGLISGLILGALIARLAPQHDAPLRRIGVVGVVAALVAAGGFGVQHWRGDPFRAERAWSSLSQSDPEHAIAQLQALVRKQPNSAQAHLALGQAYFHQQNFPQAEGEFKRVLEIHPQNNAARLDLGMVYLNEKRPEDAKTVFAQALAQDANDADAHYGTGLALADEDKYQAAIDEFKTAAAQGAQSSGVYYDMGQSYVKLKQYDDAIAAYLEEQKKSGDDSEIESALADAYQAKGMTQQADDARNKANQLKNDRHD
jgi:membrane associated rhomboid family serine protease/cytochrome c-type biogenesis protein CcmH/NrfG